MTNYLNINDVVEKVDTTDCQFESSYTSSKNANEASTIQNNTLKICGKSFNITKKQLITIVLLSVSYFLSASFYSLFAPFLPSEALHKRIGQTQVGVIFGVYELVILILMPIFGKYLQVLGVRFLFVGGMFLMGGSEILYGLIEWCPEGNIYFAISVLCRIVTAIGSSMSISYAIVGFYFPNNISSMVAMLEVFNGFGYMIGPVAGGFMYQLGGFKLPFFVMGSITFALFIIAFFIFPEVEQLEEDKRAKSLTLPFLPLFKIPIFLLSLLMILMASTSLGFLGPTIELHLSPLNLKPVQLGLILLFPPLMYIIASPIFGYFSDKYPQSIPWTMFVSGLICSVSSSFFGPIPYYNLPLKLWIFLLAFLVYSIGIGGLVIPSYSEITSIAVNHGYPNDLRLQGLIGGIFGSVWSLGALLGPIIGGFVVEKIGFNLTSFYLLVTFIVIDIIYGVFHTVKIFCPIFSINQVYSETSDVDRVISERTPLLV